MTTAKSRLGQTLAGGRPIVMAECLAPRSADAALVKQLAAALPPRLDAVVVGDNPEEPRGSALACAAILASEGRPSVLSMVTRDRNRTALEADALGAAALGVDAVLCMSGEHQSLGASPQAAGAYDIDSIQLTQAMKALLPEMPAGALAHPYQRPIELNLIRLKKKIGAGADFLLTQAVFDLDGFTEWMDAVRAADLHKRVAIIASVLPLQSALTARAHAERQAYGPVGASVIARLSQASDPAREGVAIAAETAVALKAVPGVRGIHILSGGCEGVAGAVIREAGLA